MESAMDAVLAQARAQHAVRVHRIALRIGALAGVDSESLRFAFDVVARDTLAAEAELEIKTVPAIARCAACAQDFSVESGYVFSCPLCGQLSGELRQGRELELTRIEMS